MEPLDLGELSAANRVAVELASHRTRMSFQRTRMGADRTLMAIMRTSFSLTAFGFTSFQFFRYLHENGQQVPLTAARWFGVALASSGVLLQVLGIWRHVQFMRDLREERDVLVEKKMLLRKDRFPNSVMLAVAVFLLLTGIAVLVMIAIQKLPI